MIQTPRKLRRGSHKRDSRRSSELRQSISQESLRRGLREIDSHRSYAARRSRSRGSHRRDSRERQYWRPHEVQSSRPETSPHTDSLKRDSRKSYEVQTSRLDGVLPAALTPISLASVQPSPPGTAFDRYMFVHCDKRAHDLAGTESL